MRNFICGNCEVDIEADEQPKTCPFCESDNITELCPMCGDEINEDTRVCPTCKEAV